MNAQKEELRVPELDPNFNPEPGPSVGYNFGHSSHNFKGGRKPQMRKISKSSPEQLAEQIRDGFTKKYKNSVVVYSPFPIPGEVRI